MAKQVTTMRDSNGNDIPLKYVSKYDKAKDKAVRKILARFVKARHALESVVAETVAELNELAATKESVGAKGNFSARSFDGLIQVSIRQQYNILLDERVVRARELMLGYIEGVLAKVGGNDAQALRLIVAEAFKGSGPTCPSSPSPGASCPPARSCRSSAWRSTTTTGGRPSAFSRSRSSRKKASGIWCARRAYQPRWSSRPSVSTSRTAGRRTRFKPHAP